MYMPLPPPPKNTWMYLYEFQDRIFLNRKVTIFFVDNQHWLLLLWFQFKSSCLYFDKSDFWTFHFKNKKQKLYIRFKLFHTMYIYTDLSCLVSSGLFLSGVCDANDITVKHKVMVQISKHFAIVVLSIKNK